MGKTALIENQIIYRKINVTASKDSPAGSSMCFTNLSAETNTKTVGINSGQLCLYPLCFFSHVSGWFDVGKYS